MPKGVYTREPRGKAAINALPSQGHIRREILKRRAALLEEQAEVMADKTGTYSVDPAKLKVEPEIMKHIDPASCLFEVTDPVEGRCYCWVRKDKNAIAQKRNEARFFGIRGAWQVVQSADTEAKECLTAEGTREIGDVLLMWISLENYINIQKKVQLMNAYRELGIPQKLQDFMNDHEGKVQVYATNEDPQSYLQKHGIIGPQRNQGLRAPIPTLRTEA